MKTISQALPAILSTASTIFHHPDFLSTINEGKPEDEQRWGGYLCIGDADAPFSQRQMPLALVSYGVIPDHKREQYFVNALEKNRRLQLHHPEGIVSTFQTRDELKEQWGGGIIASDGIFSFSGLPEIGDEVLNLLIVKFRDFASDAMIAQIAEHSGSLELYKKLYAKLTRGDR